jgi:hypothetical protein
MKNLFIKIYLLFALVFSFMHASAQSIDFKQEGNLHNEILSVLYAQPNIGSMNEEQRYQSMVGYVQSRYGATNFPTYNQSEETYAPFADKTFEEAITYLKGTGLLTNVQYDVIINFESLIKNSPENLEIATFKTEVETFKANNVFNNRSLSESQKLPLIALIDVSTESAVLHGVEMAKKGGCCSNCLKSHWGGVVLWDGLGAALAIMYAALTGDPVNTWNLIMQAGKWSAKYVKKKCGCCF